MYKARIQISPSVLEKDNSFRRKRAKRSEYRESTRKQIYYKKKGNKRQDCKVRLDLEGKK